MTEVSNVDGEPLSVQLIRATNEENLELLKTLLDSNPGISLAEVKDSTSDTLLHIAVRKKNFQILEHLLTYKFDIDSFNDFGETPLLMACIQPNQQIVELLIDKGANLNLGDFSGNTPLHRSAYYNHRENCRLLLEKGANVNEQNDKGLTVLHLVCTIFSDLELLAMLMCYGADVSVRSWGYYGLGATAFELCLIHDKVDFQYFLIDYVFNGVEKIPMCLEALVGAMQNESPLFFFVVLNVSEVIFDMNLFEVYLNKILFSGKDYLECFLKHFGYVIEAIEEVDDDLVDDLNWYYPEYSADFDCSRAIENLFVFFSEPFVLHFCDNINKAIKHDDLSYLIHLHKWQDMSLESLGRLIFHLLSYGAELTDVTLDQIYYYFGDADTFRILLHMDIEKISSYREKAPFPSVIYNTDIKNITFFKNPLLCEYVYDDWEKVIQFFAGRKIKDLCANKLGLEKVKKIPDVPLLLELARNAARNFIIESYGFTTSRQFYTLLKILPICNEYKSIIAFQKRLYFPE